MGARKCIRHQRLTNMLDAHIDERGMKSIAEGLTQEETANRLGMTSNRRQAAVHMAEKGAIRKLWRNSFRLLAKMRRYERAGVFK